jgi:hypothetical protein
MQSVPINTATSGDNALITPGANQAVAVLGFLLVGAGAVTAQWMSDTGGGAVALTGAMTLATGTPVGITSGNGMDAVQLMKTAPGKALNLKLGGAVQVSGFVLIDLV